LIKTIFLTNAEVVAAGKTIYEKQIRQLVETPDNIGKMLTLDIETDEYSIGDNPAETILNLKQKDSLSKLFTLRIGYQTGVSFGGLNDRCVGVLLMQTTIDQFPQLSFEEVRQMLDRKEVNFSETRFVGGRVAFAVPTAG
jgi:hypothetical protein